MKKKINDYLLVFIVIVCVLCAVYVVKTDYDKKRRETIKTVCYDMSEYFPSDSRKYEECVARNVVFAE